MYMSPCLGQKWAHVWAQIGFILGPFGIYFGPMMGPCFGPYWARVGPMFGPIFQPITAPVAPLIAGVTPYYLSVRCWAF
jgi:hypothetical protein